MTLELIGTQSTKYGPRNAVVDYKSIEGMPYWSDRDKGGAPRACHAEIFASRFTAMVYSKSSYRMSFGMNGPLVTLCLDKYSNKLWSSRCTSPEIILKYAQEVNDAPVRSETVQHEIRISCYHTNS